MTVAFGAAAPIGRTIRRGLSLLLVGAVPVLGMTPATAGADETRASADVTAGFGYANNPFAGQGGSGSTFAQVGVSPEVRIVNERRAIVIGADVFHQEYFSDFPSNTTIAARADYSNRLTEATSVHGQVGYTSALLGTFGFGGLAGIPGGTLNPIVNPPVLDPSGVGAGVGLANPGIGAPIVPGVEVGAFGAGRRQRTFTANGDFSSAISSRTSLTGNAFYVNSRFGGGANAIPLGALGNYDGYGSGLGVSRRLSEFSTAGVQGSVAAYNYEQGQSDTRVYSIQGTFSTRLSTLWSLDAVLGASFIDQQLGGTSTTLSGNVNLCRRGERSNTCIQAARTVLPTGFAGTQTQSSAGISWQAQVGENQNLSAGATYVSLDTPEGSLTTLPGGFGSLDNQYALANVGYSRAVGRRLRLSPSVYYRKVFGGAFQRADDYGGQVSLSYRLGDLR